MTDSPINLRAHEVRAILDGRKTQMRRVLDIPPLAFDAVFNDDGVWCIGDALTGHRFAELPVRYRIGDRLWVREAWRTGLAYEDLSPSEMGGEEQILFEADGATERWTRGSSAPGRFRQGKHMPRWASRLTLIVTDVRVQRLQEIGAGDAWAEGVDTKTDYAELAVRQAISRGVREVGAVDYYRALWNSINAKRPGCAWDDNPWIVALTFRAIPKNIDQIGDGDDH